MRMSILFMFFLVINGMYMKAETLTYKVTKGENISYETYSIKLNLEGFEISSENEKIILNSDYSQRSWLRKGTDDTNIAMDLHANRAGEKVFVEGIYKNNKIKKQYDIDPVPWTQCAHFTLANFAKTRGKSFRFWALSIHDMGMFEMEAENLGESTVIVNGEEVNALHVRIKPAGFAGTFWHADYWYETDDYRYVRYESVEGLPGTPPTIKELVSTNE